MAPSYDNATRAQVVTLKALGFTNEEIRSKLCLSITFTTIDRIYRRALSRGFTPDKPICLDRHVDNAHRSRRPTKQTKEKMEEIEVKVTKD